jgi:hypothetical protein
MKSKKCLRLKKLLLFFEFDTASALIGFPRAVDLNVDYLVRPRS